MDTSISDSELSISELALYVKKRHKKTVREQTLYKWIYRGRQNEHGEVRYLRSSQMGFSAPHFVRKGEINEFILWLTGDERDERR
jgi:IS30 family transposase